MRLSSFKSSFVVNISVVAFFMLLVFVSEVGAAEFSVVSSEVNKVDGIYNLNVRLSYELSDDVNEALESGIPVTLKLEIEVLSQRDFLWAQEIKALQQRYRIRYHALSEQFLVKNLNSGEQTFYKVLDDALYNLERIEQLPVFGTDLIETTKKYQLRVRSSVDISELPVPLRYFAYFSSGWRLSSGWFTWDLS